MLLFSNHAISFSLQSHTPKMKAKIKMGVTPMSYANDGMLLHRF